MICRKTGSYFSKPAYSEKDICYYHHPKNKKSNFGKSTIKTLIDDGYACNSVIPFLKKKYFEITGRKFNLT